MKINSATGNHSIANSTCQNYTGYNEISSTF